MKTIRSPLVRALAALRPAVPSLPPALLCATLALLLGGCSFFSFLPFVDDPTPKASKVGEAAALQSFEPEADLERLWSAKVGRGLGRKYLRIRPAVVADRVYAADGYGRVVAVNRFTGRRIWATSVGRPDDGPFYEFWDRRDPSFVTGGVGAGDGRILIGTTRGEVIALDAGSGAELWRTQVSSEVLAPPASGDTGVVVAQTADGRLVALEDADGAPRWSFDSQVPLLTLRGTATPVLGGGLVFAGFGDGNVSAVDEVSGAPLWKQRIMLPQGRTELDRMVDVDSTPLLAGNVLFAASFQGRLKALRPPDGNVLWELETSTHLDLAEGYGQIYVVDADDVVSAVSQTSATVVWEQDGLKYRRLTSPIAFGNYLVVGDEEGYLHVLAQSDGRFVGRRKLADGLRSPMLEVEGVIFVLGNDGTLEALQINRRG